MNRIAAVVVGAMVVVMAFAGSALGGYSEAPAPTNEVQGAGGGVAFSGGDASFAAITALALVTVGLVALFVARRHTGAAS